MNTNILEDIWCKKDIKLFLNASDEVKNNPRLINTIIDIFKDNDLALLSIINIIDTLEINDINMIDIYLHILEILDSKNIIIEAENEIDIKKMYYFTIDEIILFNYDIDLRKKAKHIFKNMLMANSTTKKILDYTATKLIKNICESLDLELLIHDNYNNFLQLNDNELLNIKLCIIEEYDKELSHYASHNLNVLKYIDEEFEKIKNDFNNYVSSEDITFNYIFSNNIKEYMKENNINEDKFLPILFYALYKQNLLKDYIMYNYESEQMYNEILNDCKNYKLEDNFDDLKQYHTVKELIKSCN